MPWTHMRGLPDHTAVLPLGACHPRGVQRWIEDRFKPTHTRNGVDRALFCSPADFQRSAQLGEQVIGRVRPAWP